MIHVFQRALADFEIDPRNVVFLAHSTTQATNALLEGDLAPVGIVGMGGGGVGGMLAKNQTAIGDIKLVTGRHAQDLPHLPQHGQADARGGPAGPSRS